MAQFFGDHVVVNVSVFARQTFYEAPESLVESLIDQPEVLAALSELGDAIDKAVAALGAFDFERPDPVGPSGLRRVK